MNFSYGSSRNSNITNELLENFSLYLVIRIADYKKIDSSDFDAKVNGDGFVYTGEEIRYDYLNFYH